MSRRKILLIEDEQDIVSVIKYSLDKEGFNVHEAASGEEGLREAAKLSPDLILLDLMLPGLSGLDVCRQLKHDHSTCGIPVIMLTAKSDDADIVAGLEIGANDYITKPFNMPVLVARVRAALRGLAQASAYSDVPLKIHDLVIDPGRYKVVAKGISVNLTVNEINLLTLLSRRPGRVFSRYQIVDAVHSKEYMVSERAVDVQIVGLRKKLGPCGEYIETVRGVGYRMRE